MIKQRTKISSEKAISAVKRSVDFWRTIDGQKLAESGKCEKDMDVVGRKKNKKIAKFS